MKTIQLIGLILLTGIIPFTAQSQSKATKWQTDTIKVSSQCEMCKEKIEEALAFTKGVKKSEVDLEKDVVVVTFSTKRTQIEDIREAISKIGYDADNVKADPKAYKKLPGCCKKPDDPDHVKHE